MAQTFDELGIPFPLFEGPVSEADEYTGVATCALCSREEHAFRVGIGGYLVVPCPRCDTETGVHVADRRSPCSSCAKPVELTIGSDRVMVCYGCLRAGKAALTKDTVFGMIRLEDAMEGRTHGVPGPATAPEPERIFAVGPGGAVTFDPQAPAPPRRDEAPWVKKALPREVMLELLRTPRYTTWQGERWQFHGDEPMVYVGTWARTEFNAHADDGDGQALFRRVVAQPPPGDWSDWLGERSGDHGVSVYVFRSRDGSRYAAHFDMD